MKSNPDNSGGVTSTTVVIAISIAAFFAGSWLLLSGPGESESAGIAAAVESDTSSALFPVTVNRPTAPPKVLTGQRDVHGNEIKVACSSCHTVRPPNRANRSAADLDEFHSGLVFSHVSVACLSCHNPDNYDTLRLADGTSVEFTDVMTLCGQCHGSQMRDFEHGVHGGMTGYWDLTRGPRTRNNCIDCHDPHAPAFPHMTPTFKPRD